MITRCLTSAPKQSMDLSRSDYVRALEEERKKIQLFRRELPLCMQLVTQAIESFRQRMDDRPVLEEFIPLKPSLSSSSKERLTDAQKSIPLLATGSPEKLDWLKSVQLWNQSAETEEPPPPPPPPPPPVKPIAVSANGGAFHPFVRQNKVAAPASSNASKGGVCVGGGDGGGDDKKEGQSQSHRKSRRCWSPELHRRFLHALEQLGGAHVATPKQIKELMKVDGLTNDEVKSHLQKYRLYHRRRSPEAKSTDSIHHVPQFVLVRGIWVPPPQGSSAAVEIAGSDPPAPGVYTPSVALASDLRFKQQKHNMAQTRGKNNDDDDDGASNSSSSQTTTASPHRN